MELNQQNNLLIDSITAYKSRSETLMLEGAKVDTVLGMMNKCSDQCKLSYKENGILNKNDTEVACFTSCIEKAYKHQK